MALPYNPDAYHRRSVRLKGYGYTRAGAYFVTIVTRNRECLFGAVEADNIRLSPPGAVVDQCLAELKQHFPGRCWHFEENPQFHNLDMPDGSHMISQDALRFSDWVAGKIKPLLDDARFNR